MYSRLVVALYAFVLMTSYGQAGTRLSASEIRALAPGDYVGTWKAKRKLHLTLNTNGTISGSVDGFRYRGNWYVSGQSLCVAFNRDEMPGLSALRVRASSFLHMIFQPVPKSGINPWCYGQELNHVAYGR